MVPRPRFSQEHWRKNGDACLVLLFSLVPLFMHFPYRANIFLSWEGAYRLSLGQVPYRDFGLPMGFGFWIVPALFFKVFGPSMLSLVKAQVALNILGGLSFRGILQKLRVPDGVRLAAVLTFCLSYILVNFWPWYNNTVIIYEIAGLNLLVGALQAGTANTRRYGLMAGACVFLFLSFFTKQDGGALAFGIALVLVAWVAWSDRRWKDLVLFLLFYGVLAGIFILPFTRYSFGYWFNHGQPPHTARLDFRGILAEFLGASLWIKFYLMMWILVVVAKWKGGDFLKERGQVLFALLTLGILGEAAVFQVTSYIPPDNNIFFHSFSIAFILCGLSEVMGIPAQWGKNTAWLVAGVALWWSGNYWKYLDRLTARVWPPKAVVRVSPTGENVIDKDTYELNRDTTHYEDESTWVPVSKMKTLRGMLLPPSTVAGIGRMRQLPAFADAGPGKQLRVLNMSELTPLEYELGFYREKGYMEPLWYHLGVATFNRQADTFCARIGRGAYEAVLFEYIPELNNFFPFRIRDSLLASGTYALVDSFLAPRRPTNAVIEVFVRK